MVSQQLIDCLRARSSLPPMPARYDKASLDLRLYGAVVPVRMLALRIHMRRHHLWISVWGAGVETDHVVGVPLGMLTMGDRVL